MVTRREGVGDIKITVSEAWKAAVTVAPILALLVTGWMNLNSTLNTLKTNDAAQSEAIAKQAKDFEDLKATVTTMKTGQDRQGVIIKRIAYKFKIPLGDSEPQEWTCWPNCTEIGKKRTPTAFTMPSEPAVTIKKPLALFDPPPEPIAKKEQIQDAGDFPDVVRIQQEHDYGR